MHPEKAGWFRSSGIVVTATHVFVVGVYFFEHLAGCKICCRAIPSQRYGREKTCRKWAS